MDTATKDPLQQCVLSFSFHIKQAYGPQSWQLQAGPSAYNPDNLYNNMEKKIKENL